MGQDKRRTNDEIQLRAYEIFLARKGGPGDQLSDWLAAERELNEASNQDAGATPTAAPVEQATRSEEPGAGQKRKRAGA